MQPEAEETRRTRQAGSPEGDPAGACIQARLPTLAGAPGEIAGG
jgi:hypothetical protein